MTFAYRTKSPAASATSAGNIVHGIKAFNCALCIITVASFSRKSLFVFLFLNCRELRLTQRHKAQCCSHTLDSVNGTERKRVDEWKEQRNASQTIKTTRQMSHLWHGFVEARVARRSRRRFEFILALWFWAAA
jgi:hypothetical protein